MAIVWKKQREHQNLSADFTDRFIDGKIVDTTELHDRVVIFQQLGIMLALPQKRSNRNQI